MSKTRWGILSTGYIAGMLAEGLSVVEDAELVAVGSRSQANADAFADTWGAPHRHASYEALAADPDVDVIYVATPHPYHYENTMMCLNAGKHVLVEKPFAMNARQAGEMVALARQKGLFLMEAMWTRFTPAMAQVRQWLAAGAIGDVQLVRANLSFNIDFNPESRLFKPELGGGAMLDVGIYPISFAFMVLGTPTSVYSTATLGPTGTDDRSAYMFGYDGGKTAQLSSAVRLNVPVEADIIGTDGMIKIHQAWINPRKITLGKLAPEGVVNRLIVEGRLYDTETLHIPTEGNGYNYEVMEVGRCIQAGKQESDIMPLDQSLAIMRTMDTIRGQWGLTYPNE
ncbi:MAG: Gfo/Idh/MocA family oxidoreductase [Anaerolineae bacterium]|nr:Gfo/Idh/MocA family oxidoreductase [Anaerolineae bacterium]